VKDDVKGKRPHKGSSFPCLRGVAPLLRLEMQDNTSVWPASVKDPRTGSSSCSKEGQLALND
jgi:hypothetical protein